MRRGFAGLAVAFCCSGAVTALLGAARNGMEARVESMQLRIDSLERRVGVAEGRLLAASLLNNTVKAPFHVVNDSGRPVMDVVAAGDAQGLTVSNSNGKPVLALWTAGENNVVRVRNESGMREVVLGTDKTSAVVTLRDGPGSEHTRSKLAVDAHAEPHFLTYNSKYMSVLDVTHGSHGGGLIQVDEPGGEVRVEIGATPEGFGVVRAGPGGACTAPMGPIAPSCILGRKGN